MCDLTRVQNEQVVHCQASCSPTTKSLTENPPLCAILMQILLKNAIPFSRSPLSTYPNRVPCSLSISLAANLWNANIGFPRSLKSSRSVSQRYLRSPGLSDIRNKAIMREEQDERSSNAVSLAFLSLRGILPGQLVIIYTGVSYLYVT